LKAEKSTATMNLTKQEKDKIIELINAEKPLPAVYKGKERKEDIIAQTPAAPFQLIRTFNNNNPFKDGWRKMLIFGDNLLALKTLYDDQRGQNIYKTKNHIKFMPRGKHMPSPGSSPGLSSALQGNLSDFLCLWF
jgi:site-specific DNA-methyltransferase (adenine-specific)/adenine-specific DNA-methyltransferase